MDPLFEPLALTPDLVLRNRVAMAPMTTWASNDDGTVSDDEEAYYRRRAKDVGLVKLPRKPHSESKPVFLSSLSGKR